MPCWWQAGDACLSMSVWTRLPTDSSHSVFCVCGGRLNATQPGAALGCCTCSTAGATAPRGTHALSARTSAHTPPAQTDPEAARMVFESGVRLTMVPLEVRVCVPGGLAVWVRAV
jgi:hypothetical protein